MSNDTPDSEADHVIAAMEAAVDRLSDLRIAAARADTEAKRLQATALLEARTLGFRSREERDAHAVLASAEAQEAAAICERTYRDTLTYIRTLQTRLDLIRTQIVSNRDLRV
jgi:regulator of protease activity HflC (stomatin/prohibitin superfamily)